MCGIAAIWTSRGEVSEWAIARATRALSHRGPDHQQTWIDTGRKVALGHARLSIIDLEGGVQPIANESGDIHIAVNGEFYGFETIRGDLERRGHRFRTGSDSEIALHAYEEHGIRCIDCLRGEFAFVLWDSRAGKLFACRDRFGIKPLYYAWNGDDLCIASEVKALFAAGVPAEWDEDSFYQQIFCFPSQDRTLFKGIRQLPPAHYMIANSTGISVSRYWDLDYPRLPIKPRSEAEHVEEIRTEMEEAVRLRLRADVPVGCFLSGGIDSSALLSIASREGAPLRAFTIAFDDPVFDESPAARRMAQFVNADCEVVPAPAERLADSFIDAVHHAETLGMNLHGVARYRLCAAIHEAGYKTCLTGEGADEVFGGYAQFRQDLLPDTPEAPGRVIPQSLRGVKQRLGFVPAWLEKIARDRAIRHIFLRRDYTETQRSEYIYSSFVDAFDVAGQMRGRPSLMQSMYLWTRSVLPNYILFAERLEMAHGIETRLPYLDHRLFEAARNLPVSLLIGGTEKLVLREAVRGLVPDEVYRRGKQPFLAPSAYLAPGGGMHELANDILNGEQLRDHPFFEPSAVLDVLDSLPSLPISQRQAIESALLVILCSCVLQERMRLGNGRTATCAVN